MKKIYAGIVTYNPDIIRLQENLKAIIDQVDCVILIDNGSTNIDDVKIIVSKWGIKVSINENKKNLGIAKALNQIMETGYKDGIDWVITLDQDSVCPQNIIERFLPYTNTSDVGIICPIFEDRSFGTINISTENKIKFVDVCITSASLTSVKAWNVVKGFDESMFIDGVDTDFCLTLREHNYKILQCQDVVLLHEIGHNSKIVNILGHKQVVFNHSAFRYYYICRNVIYNNRKHPRFRSSPLRGVITVFYRWLLILLYEKKKFEKTVSVIKGTLNGFISPTNHK